MYSSRSEKDLKWLRIKDDTVKFEPNVSLHGDVLLRCRHLCRKSKDDDDEQERVTSVFRVAFNTGYVQRDSLILQREELDGTGSRSKFQDAFRVELYFQEEQSEDSGTHEDHNAAAAIKPFWDHVDRRKRRLQRMARKKREEVKKSKAAVKDDDKISTPKIVRSKDAFSLGDLPDDEEVEFDPTESENSSKTSTPELKRLETNNKIATEGSSDSSPKSELKRLEKIEEKLGLTKEEERRKIEGEDTPPSSPFDVDAELKKLEISASTLDNDIDGILGDIDLDDDALNTTTTGIEEDDPDLGDLEDYLKTFENA